MDQVFGLGWVRDAFAGYEEMIRLEQALHRDLLEVDCRDNCNKRGKTWLILTRIFEMVRQCPQRSAWAALRSACQSWQLLGCLWFAAPCRH